MLHQGFTTQSLTPKETGRPPLGNCVRSLRLRLKNQSTLIVKTALVARLQAGSSTLPGHHAEGWRMHRTNLVPTGMMLGCDLNLLSRYVLHHRAAEWPWYESPHCPLLVVLCVKGFTAA